MKIPGSSCYFFPLQPLVERLGNRHQHRKARRENWHVFSSGYQGCCGYPNNEVAEATGRKFSECHSCPANLFGTNPTDD
jgi:hypothetical protein